jgi:LL-diaminopimelate aminotransferase
VKTPLPHSSQRLTRLPEYIFVSITAEIQELARKGHTVVRLDIGNPDMPPPDHVIQTLGESAGLAENHGYSGYRGTREFREAVASHYQRRFGVHLNPETEVLPLIGSKEGIVNLSLAYLDKGDTVLVPEIGYPAYAMSAQLVGANVIHLPMSASNGYMIDVDQIDNKQLEKAKLLWINYPNNPTGGTATLKQYEHLVEFCIQHDILLASDNPYVEINYDGTSAHSVLEVAGSKSTSIEYMSFSKTYNMAGWRLGAAVGNADTLGNLLHIKSNMDSGHFKPIYTAGINALTETSSEWLTRRNQIYQQRRDKILEKLPSIGLKVEHVPTGSMYIWAKVTDMDADIYVSKARQEALVSLAPGLAYGPGGKGYVRISVGVPDRNVDLALDRLTQWYKTMIVQANA